MRRGVRPSLPTSSVLTYLNKSVNSKRCPGRDIVIWGSLALVQSLCETKLIDQYHFIVSPVILGTGKKLFPERQLDLEFGEAKVLEGGYLILKYAPV
jgi:dihydrofolate reductase